MEDQSNHTVIRSNVGKAFLTMKDLGAFDSGLNLEKLYRNELLRTNKRYSVLAIENGNGYRFLIKLEYGHLEYVNMSIGQYVGFCER